VKQILPFLPLHYSLSSATCYFGWRDLERYAQRRISTKVGESTMKPDDPKILLQRVELVYCALVSVLESLHTLRGAVIT
jgi:hypothetical protein